jgi:uncharacterized protein (DUF1697 family)
MESYVALFRGLNVGGKNVLPMKALGDFLENLVFRNVETYIQSGNVVFESSDKSAARLSAKIRSEMERCLGIKSHVLLLRLEELKEAILANPFSEAASDPRALHVGFLTAVPQNPNLQKLESLKKKSERYHLTDKVFYLHAPEGVGRSKLAANVERVLAVTMTGRNWRTVCKIWEMAKEMS